MYKCQEAQCKKHGGTPIASPRQPLNKIITERRPKTYQRIIKKGRQGHYTEEIQGWEIVKEHKVCSTCYERLTGLKGLTAKTSMKQIMQAKEKKSPPRKKKNHKHKRRNNFSNKIHKQRN